MHHGLLVWLLSAVTASCAVESSSHTPADAAPVAAAGDPVTEVSLTRLADRLWLHTSTRELDGYGPFASHGLVVEHADGVLMIDSAWGAEATTRLLAQIQAQIGRAPGAAIITDFHDDRAGGVAVLETAGVEVFSSYGIAHELGAASQPAPALALALPLFTGELAGTKVEVLFPGPGHSPENLVVWLPERKLLFGGCLLRALESRGLGNTADADLHAWGPSVRAVRERYADARTVIPSHGAPGDARLLDHTLALIDIALDSEAASTDKDPTSRPTKMAITVDDLPRHGPLPPGTSRAQVHAKLIAAFERHGVPEVRGLGVPHPPWTHHPGALLGALCR